MKSGADCVGKKAKEAGVNIKDTAGKGVDATKSGANKAFDKTKDTAEAGWNMAKGGD